MPVYTVHQPLPRKGEASADPDRFAFVRDGFYFWAFVLGPLWMLWRRLWLVTALYLLVMVVMQVGLWASGASGAAQFLIGLLLALLLGLEAATLQRWTLSRRGWKYLGIVVGDDLEVAERRFFAAWLPAGRRPAEAAAASTPPGGRMPKENPDILGLFPEPGTRR